VKQSVLASVLAVSGLLVLAGCWGDSSGVYVTAPFNEKTELAEVSAVWKNTGEERVFAEASRLDEAQVRFQYRVDVENRLDDKLYLDLGKLELLDEEGLSLGGDTTEVKCVLGAGRSEAVLQGNVWVDKRLAKTVEGFRVDRFGVPLSDRGRAMYREWLLQGRPGEAAKIDAELAVYAGAPACP
jgi:hypothetical protein